MNKTELRKDMMASVNGASMMTASDVQRYLGKGRTYTQEFLRGVDYYGEAKGKMYHVGDVADKLISLKRR